MSQLAVVNCGWGLAIVRGKVLHPATFGLARAPLANRAGAAHSPFLPGGCATIPPHLANRGRLPLESGSGNNRAGFDAFAAWKEYQAVAMHFNDLLLRLRTASLAAVGAFATIAGVVIKTDVDSHLRWATLAGVFALLGCFWVAIWVLDFLYYNRLLIGAVDALIELEEKSAQTGRVSALTLSTKIERVVAEGRLPNKGKLGRESARWWFYGIVFTVLLFGFAFSLLQA